MAPGVAIKGPQGSAHYAHLLAPGAWYHNKRLLALNGWIFLLLITSYSNGYDGSMMNGLQTLKIWQTDFDHPHGGTLGLFNAIQNIGALAGYPFAPYISDWAGRRRAIFLGAFIMCVGAALQTGAQSIGMFIGARFLMGFGLTFAANAAPLLVSELAYPPHRAPLTSCYNSLWYSGSIVAAWSTFGTFFINSGWSWRIPSLLQALPSIAQCFLIWGCPESPRWLLSKGREAEARRVLAYYHANGDDTNALVEFEFTEIKAALEFDRTVASNVGYKSLFTTRGNLKRMRIIIALAFFSQWSGNGLVSYYLNQVFTLIHITDPTIQLLINGILQIWNLFWALGAGMLCEKIGRRPLFLTSCAGMLLFWTAQTICNAEVSKGSRAAGPTDIVFIFLFYAAYDLAFTPLIVSYTVEILPYHIRAKGFNVFNFAISLSLIFNQYVNPVALGKITWKYYLVYVCWICFEFGFIYFYVVETKNRTLEETAALFDGEEALERVAQEGAHAAHMDVHTPDEKASLPEEHEINKI